VPYVGGAPDGGRHGCALPLLCGLDVHKGTGVVGVRVATNGPATTEVRTFDTTTPGLLALSDWLADNGCTHVAMEATGVYWKPVWHILSDGDVTLILANAAHVNVPGRKTDVADALWLADLLAHGLVRASFVPEAPVQEMRALLRTRKQLVREQASHVQRIQKTLEDANLKLGSVLTQIIGVSGRAILQALIEGEDDPDKLLALMRRGVKAPPEKLRAALQGRITERHRFLLHLHLRQVDALVVCRAPADHAAAAGARPAADVFAAARPGGDRGTGAALPSRVLAAADQRPVIAAAFLTRPLSPYCPSRQAGTCRQARELSFGRS
jgi:transposase